MHVELFWYLFCTIKAVMFLFAFLVVGGLLKLLLRFILSKRANRPPVKHAIVESFEVVRPLESFDASQSKAIDDGLRQRKEAVGSAMRHHAR